MGGQSYEGDNPLGDNSQGNNPWGQPTEGQPTIWDELSKHVQLSVLAHDHHWLDLARYTKDPRQ
jgi:hypothetical protein